MNPAAITQQQQQQSRKRPNGNTSFSVITPTTSHLAQQQQQQHQQQYSNHHQNNTPTLHMNHPNFASSSSQYNNDTQPPLKKRRLVSLPSTIVNIVPESQILNDLQSFEYRLDRILSDKKLKMRQLLTDPKSTKRTLRIQIYCEKQTITSSSSSTTATTAAPASNIMVGVTPSTTAPTTTTTTTTHADTTNITTTTTTPTDGTTPSVGGVNNTDTASATALSSSASGTTTTSNKSSYIEENWTIYIQGALLTSDTTTANNNNNNNNSSSGSSGSSEAEDHEFKFTHFLKSVIVEMDEELFPLNKSDRLIEWHRTHGFEDCEGFVFTRRVRIENSSIALNHRYPMKILLGIRDDPPLYHTSPALTQILELSPSGSVLLAAHNSSSSSSGSSSGGGSSSSGITGDGGDYHMKKTDGMLRKKSGTSEETSAPPPLSLNNILTGVWDYIKVNKLQDQNEKNRINCDARLKELFGSDSVTFANVLQQTKQHLLLPEPKHIDYTICRTQMGQSFEQTFFIDVNVSKTHQGVVEALLSEKPLPDVLKFETQIQKALESIEDHKKNRDFMLGFSQDPINFIHRLINSQTRELLMLSNKQDLEHQRYSSYYRSPWIQDAASRYASKK